MNKKKTINYFFSKKMNEETLLKATNLIDEFIDFFESTKLTKQTLETYFIENYKHDYFPYLVIARLLYFSNEKELYLFLKTYVGQYGVITSIEKTMEKNITKKQKELIFDNLKKPFLGMSYKDINQFTMDFTNRLEGTLTPDELKTCLAKNNHQIPLDSFFTEKSIYLSSDSLDKYLQDLHQRKVQMLQKHYTSGTIWTEQLVTKELLDYVKNNQEVLSAKRVDNYLFVTKVPYDITAYFNAKTDKEKAYALCHCPFARESTLLEDINISPNWCYCSGGFAKVLFETIFDQELPIEITHSALKGDQKCRFKIDISAVQYN